MIPYGRQTINEEDIRAVVEVLQSDWLTTGPKVDEFEQAFAGFVGCKEAVCVSNGTAALHAAMYALEIGPGDEVIVPAMTFAATANCVVFQGATPVYVDVDPKTLLISPDQVETKITSRSKAVIAVDYTGHPAEYDRLRDITSQNGIALVSDACHSLGASYRSRPVGTLADLNTFSFHPVKHITTGEGGMITTDDPRLAQRMRLFRNHGISSDHRQRDAVGSWFYEMVDLGYNYRLTDLQCAIGISQLQRLPQWLSRRREIARQYDAALAELETVTPLDVESHVTHAYHLYVVRFNLDLLQAERVDIYSGLRGQDIGANVHYIPVHLHPFYRKHFGTGPGLCPVAEAAYEQIISLPIFPSMTNADVEQVLHALNRVLSKLGNSPDK
jgi:perosamine synthetase